ncbi:AbgT family transporter [Endozoicomonas lisbonensis]|uniref:Aminobenzoyl-glutamate transport protein n=2 Tax=Endozoicomonas lisbonensis TaxID=3120522 RepID=A0ABV2SDK5_9GAMM
MSYDSEVLPTGNANNTNNKRSAFSRFLAAVEWLGNLLPHPITLFALFAVGIVVLSGLASWAGLSVVDPRPEGAPGRAAGGIIEVVNLLSADGLRMIVSNLVRNFTGFAPLGTVLVALLGVGIAEHSGLLSAAVRSLVMKASRHTVTMIVVFAGVISNTAAELGYVVLIPLAAMIFHSLGRHPIAGLAAAFAGVSGGYSANLLIGTVDPLLSGITEAAAQIIDPTYAVGPEVNWYFMMLSTFMITFVGSWVTTRIVEPQLGEYNSNDASIDLSEEKMEEVSAVEKRGLKLAGVSLVILTALIAMTVVPESGILRHPETGAIAGSPFLRGIVAMILVFFAVPGIVYGKVVGTIRNDRDVIDCMSKSMSTMGMYIVLVFFAAQFVAYFSMTNFGTIFAVLGAEFLQSIGLTGPLLFLFFILMCGFVNLMIGSASAQWAVTAPIFVPMLMLVGYAPEVIQAAYRIGDSVTNIITPMMSYFGLIVSFATRYKKDLGIGTLVSVMLPYSLFFLIGWSLLFFLWVFGLDMPVGPGAATFYSAG